MTFAGGAGPATRFIGDLKSGPGGGYYKVVTENRTRRMELTNDGVTDHADLQTTMDIRGTDPITGQDVSQYYDSDDPSTWTDQSDWFGKIANFGAGMADTLTGGLTQKIRQGAGYDDVVNKNSTAYKWGTYAGTAVDIALTPVNPCGKAVWLAKGLKALSAAQAAGHTIAAGEAFAEGDYAGGALNLVSARMSAGKIGKSCFTAGTPILTEAGSKAIEELRSLEEHGNSCDFVLSRSEHDPAGLVRTRRVLQRFVTVAPILNLHVGGKIIGTTAEHPFYVEGFGWKTASELRIGDKIIGLSSQSVAVEGVADSGRVETVYNVEVEGDHTYFVGEAGWGFAVWAHNAECLKIDRAARHGSPPHHERMVAHAKQAHTELPRGVSAVEVRTNQGILNPNNPSGRALSQLRPDVQILGTDGKIYMVEVNRTGGTNYHRLREAQLRGALGKDFGGYRGINIPR